MNDQEFEFFYMKDEKKSKQSSTLKHPDSLTEIHTGLKINWFPGAHWQKDVIPTQLIKRMLTLLEGLENDYPGLRCSLESTSSST